MEIGQGKDEKIGFFGRQWRWVKKKAVKMMNNVKKIGEDDPRRIIHSFKVGLALSLVSLFYYFRPLYNDFGVAAMWAVLTVVVVFEFSVGATLGKGLNRAFATLLAGTLAVGAHHLASLSGKKGEPIILGAFVFIFAAGATFARFFPRIKARYDYGVVIFILTFSLVAVSGYRVNELVALAHQRLSTIMIGSSVCVFISIFVCPVWAGEDLHRLLALNIELLAIFLEGFPKEYFQKMEIGENVVVSKEKSFLQGYKAVLNSKTSEETLANFARWEPGHGRFGFRHPWKQYLKIGSLTRQCAYYIEGLNTCINSEKQAPTELRQQIQAGCTKMSSECGKTLSELALAIQTMTKPISAANHLAVAKTATADLKTAMKTTVSNHTDVSEMLSAATIASLLITIIEHTEKIVESVDQLASMAKFKDTTVILEKSPSLHRAYVKPFMDIDGPHICITVCGPMSDSREISKHCGTVRDQHVEV
ncbi:aluminum-activated malate transporter 2-like [Tasmannia lanceolata]|uniref:aluminum-activated malate transporter 2-like n=1 Tax=Tasmannia lanceolata TaxID=3420 RepID=UPI004062AE8C